MFGLNLAAWVALAGLIMALLTIAGKLGALGTRVRAWWNRQPGINSGNWCTPEEAKTRLVERTLVEEWTEARHQYAYARAAADEARAELHSINAQMPREEANRRSENFQAADKVHHAASVRLQAAEDATRDDLTRKLREGALIAKGYVAPHTHGAEAKLIPKREWQFLDLLEYAERAQGGGVIYFEVKIRHA